MPRVSVIVPVYNGAKTIREAIQSALQQTFSDFELVVINDGSDDSTLSILDDFRDPRIRVQSYSNAGLEISRNRGLNSTTGEIVAFLDADDVWLPEKLRLQVAALDEHPEAALAYAWSDYIDAAGRLIHPGRHSSDSGWVLDSLMVNGNFVGPGSNPAIRRDAIAECGWFDESLGAAGDWDMCLRLAARYPVAVVKEPLVLYRIHRDARSSADVLRQERWCLEVLQRAFQRTSAPADLKRQSMANLYAYLTIRALVPPVSRSSSRVAMRFLRSAVQFEPLFLVRSTFPTVALVKIGAALMLPSGAQRAVLDAARWLRRRISGATSVNRPPVSRCS
jgi:glycosyltransferase involved in cell wall biosynthesis